MSVLNSLYSFFFLFFPSLCKRFWNMLHYQFPLPHFGFIFYNPPTFAVILLNSVPTIAICTASYPLSTHTIIPNTLWSFTWTKMLAHHNKLRCTSSSLIQIFYWLFDAAIISVYSIIFLRPFHHKEICADLPRAYKITTLLVFWSHFQQEVIRLSEIPFSVRKFCLASQYVTI